MLFTLWKNAERSIVVWATREKRSPRRKMSSALFRRVVSGSNGAEPNEAACIFEARSRSGDPVKRPIACLTGVPVIERSFYSYGFLSPYESH
jgi:hypothetical protein